MSNDMKWNLHIKSTCTKANRILGILKRNFSKCSATAKEMAYKSLIRPILEYASTIWDPYQNIHKDEVEKVQKRAARFVTGNYNYEPGTMTTIMSTLKWKSLQERRLENRIILFYKGLKGKANIPINGIQHSRARGRNERELKFNIPYARTDCYKYSFIPRTVRDWNNVPQHIISDAENASNKIQRLSNLIKHKNT